jgi:Homing endonuclease associated repeat
VFFQKQRIKFRGELCVFSAANLFPWREVFKIMPTTKPRGKRHSGKLHAGKPAARLHSAKLHTVKPHSVKTAAKFRATKLPIAKRCTKEQIISAIQAAARKLGHAPTSVELKRLNGITLSQVARRFGTYRAAVCAAGLKPNQGGVRVEAAALLEDWGKVARKVGRVPSRPEYEEAGGYSRHCFTRGFQTWTEVPAAFSRFVASGGLAGDWTDVLKTIREGPMPTCGKCNRLAERREAVRLASQAEVRRTKGMEPHLLTAGQEMRQPAGGEMRRTEEINRQAITAMATVLPPPLWGKKCVTATMLAVFVADLAPSGLQWITGAFFPRRVLEDRPLMGAPTQLPGLAHEPVNEMGVLVLFAMLSRQLGFILDSVQAAFPDLLARMEVQPGRWQPVRIEVEYLSSSFRRHGHDARQCDLIVCWRHDWKNCPPNLQVLELSKVVKQLQMDRVIW